MKFCALFIFFTISCVNDVSVKIPSAPALQPDSLVPSQATNDAPVAQDFSLTMKEEEQKIIDLKYELKEGLRGEKCEIPNESILEIVDLISCSCPLDKERCQLTVKGKKDEFGVANVKFAITANGKTSNTANLEITIENLDDPPELVLSNSNLFFLNPLTTLEIKENGLPEQIYLHINDPDSLPILCTDVAFTSNLVEVTISGDASPCEILITPSLNQVSEDTITFSVHNGLYASTDLKVNLNILSVNDRPVIAIDSTQTTTTKEDAPLSVSFKISDVDTPLECTDTYLKATYDTSKISSHSFSGSNNNCSITLTPALTKLDSSVAVTITVSDKDPTDPKSAETSFTLNITDIKMPPVLTLDPETISVYLKQTVPKVSVTISDQDSDLNCASSITVSSSNTSLISSSQITISPLSGNGPSWTCLMNLTPNPDIAGESTIKLSLKDESGNTVEKSLKLTVKPITPSISFSPNDVDTKPYLGNISQQLKITPAINAGGSTVSDCTISPALPANLIISKSNCEITGIPSAPLAKTEYNVTLKTAAGLSVEGKVFIAIPDHPPTHSRT